MNSETKQNKKYVVMGIRSLDLHHKASIKYSPQISTRSERKNMCSITFYFTVIIAQKMKFSIKDFFSKSFLRIWSFLLKKSLMENFIFCPVVGIISYWTFTLPSSIPQKNYAEYERSKISYFINE